MVINDEPTLRNDGIMEPKLRLKNRANPNIHSRRKIKKGTLSHMDRKIVKTGRRECEDLKETTRMSLMVEKKLMSPA
jgi:hypothetical protein